MDKEDRINKRNAKKRSLSDLRDDSDDNSDSHESTPPSKKSPQSLIDFLSSSLQKNSKPRGKDNNHQGKLHSLCCTTITNMLIGLIPYRYADNNKVAVIWVAISPNIECVPSIDGSDFVITWRLVDIVDDLLHPGDTGKNVAITPLTVSNSYTGLSMMEVGKHLADQNPSGTIRITFDSPLQPRDAWKPPKIMDDWVLFVVPKMQYDTTLSSDFSFGGNKKKISN